MARTDVLRFANVAVVVVAACSQTQHNVPATPRTSATARPQDSAGPDLAIKARALLVGDGVAYDRVGAIRLYQRACVAGHAPSCIAVIHATGFEDLHERAFGEVLKLCAAGDRKSCRVARARAVIPDAMKWCDAGAGTACTALAGERRDARLLQKGCDLGDPHACFKIEPATSEWTLKGYRALWSGCDAGVAVDCLDLASRVYNEKDLWRALQTQAHQLSIDDCLAADSDGCYLAQHAVRNELEVDQIGCALSPSLCRPLAAIYQKSSKVDAAASVLERSCLTTLSDSYDWKATDCAEGADLMQRADAKRAAKMRERACSLDKKLCSS